MKFSTDERIDTYNDWQERQKIPINRGFFIEDLRKVEVAPWEMKGGSEHLSIWTGPEAPMMRTCARSRRENS
jgi:hypothetical protein